MADNKNFQEFLKEDGSNKGAQKEINKIVSTLRSCIEQLEALEDSQGNIEQYLDEIGSTQMLDWKKADDLITSCVKNLQKAAMGYERLKV